MKNISENEKDLVIAWLLSSDTGVSSESICRYMLGIPDKWQVISPPWDASDRGRCIRLLNKIPAWWKRLDEMSSISENWKKQIALIKKEANKI